MKSFKSVGTTFAIISVFSLVSGCSTTADGQSRIGFGNASLSPEQTQKLEKQLESNSKKQGGKAAINAAVAIHNHVGTITIGEVGVFQAIQDKDREKIYEQHVKTQKEAFNRDAKLTLAQFTQDYPGFCSIEVFYIPGVMTRRSQAMVPTQLKAKIDFPSYLASATLGKTGDLVAVKSGVDGIPTVDRVLCRKSEDSFRQCAKKYEKGLFDMRTGQELDSSFKPKEDGALINVRSYEVMKD